MKITRIDAEWVHVPIPPSGQHVSNFGLVASFDSVIVRIETDRGIVGWGEAKAGVGSAASCAGLTAIIKRDFAPLLLGQDARDITRLWDVLYNTPRDGHAIGRGYGLPQLGRRGLYRAIAGQKEGAGATQMALLWVLNLADGGHSLLDMAERSGLPFREIAAAARLALQADLILEQEF